MDGFGSGGGTFGGGGITPFGSGAPAGFGGGTSKLTGTNAPGTISPFEQGLVGNAVETSGEAMMNRYGQLGLSGQGATPTSPGGPPGQAPMPTAEAMDLGVGFPGGMPSLGGGITGQGLATLGQIQDLELQQPGGGGGGGGKGGGMGGIGQMLGPMMMMGGK